MSSTSDDTNIPPKYTVNLDDPAETRWRHVIKDYPGLAEIFHDFLLDVVPDYAIPLLEEIGRDIFSYIPSPYAGEILGISKAANVSVGEVLIINLGYDITAGCTSIVCEDLQGNIWHSRNFDYKRSPKQLRSISITVDFQQGGKTQYTAVTTVGYVGIITGQKPKTFTVTLNERDQGGLWRNLLVALLDRTAKPVGFLIRDTLATSGSYSEALHKLSSTDMYADAYFTLGGVNPGEGVVITRSRLSTDNVWYINTTQSRWFVLETNYDHWVPPPLSDDRRHPGIKAMKKMGRGNISTKNLFRVLSVPPVLNERTVSTTVMSAAHPSLLQSWIRHPNTTHARGDNF